MNYFLVDYENVNVSGFNGVSKLTENDVVVIFNSENAQTLTFGMHRRINESKAEIKFQKVNVNEKNALDFQLCAYLGFLIRDKINDENVENIYYIVSNDKSYSVLQDYCRGHPQHQGLRGRQGFCLPRHQSPGPGARAGGAEEAHGQHIAM